MKYFMDTEFLEEDDYIHLISIGIVCEDGRELYLECDLVPEKEYYQTGREWLRDNVLPNLDWYKNKNFSQTLSTEEISQKIIQFVGKNDRAKFWCYFGDYDWVVFAKLFGKMIYMPKNLGMQAMDLYQRMDLLDVRKRDLPKLKGTAHNALDDARWVKTALEYLDERYCIDVYCRPTSRDVARQLRHHVNTANETRDPAVALKKLSKNINKIAESL